MKRFILELTGAEAIALSAMAGEGAEGLLTDDSAARSYIGDARAIAAATRALDKLANVTTAARTARDKRKGRK